MASEGQAGVDREGLDYEAAVQNEVEVRTVAAVMNEVEAEVRSRSLTLSKSIASRLVHLVQDRFLLHCSPYVSFPLPIQLRRLPTPGTRPRRRQKQQLWRPIASV